MYPGRYPFEKLLERRVVMMLAEKKLHNAGVARLRI